MKAYNFVTVFILILVSCKEVKPTKSTVKASSKNKDTFFYFAYGSKLLAKRMRVNYPSAQFYSIAKLPNYRLDFASFDHKLWNGAFATVVEDSNTAMWGVLWTLEAKDVVQLDEQEGVKLGTYQVRNVSVHTPEGKTLKARTYQLTVEPPKLPAKDVPPERQPSDTYMKAILYGAFENSLPMHYIRLLFTFPTNGKLACRKAMELLGHPFNAPEST